jgi:NAD(P)H-flavin reductase
MNKIIKKVQYSEKVFRFDVEAPLIAKSRKAGNFVIIRVDNNSERMPLTIADADIEKGTITLVVQKVGLSSTKLCALNEGDEIHDVVGPLGNPTHIENFGTVICAGGGVGVAPMLPIIKALKAAGNRVLSVIAGRNKDLVIMEDEVRASSDELIIMTDDGSYGEKGVVTVGIEKFINQEHIDKVFAIGPPIMMKFCCLLTQKYNLSTDVSLNTIMVDGTGMCGACRLTIGGKTKFVCIDGPEFDGAQVDWDEMFKRMGTFKDVERKEMEHFEEHLATVDAGKKKETTDVFLQEIPMAESVLAEVWLFAAFFHNNVVGCVLTFRNLLARDVRNFEQLVGHIVLCFLHDLFKSLSVCLEHSYLSLCALSFLFLTFLHKGTNLLSKLVSLLLVVIQLLLSFTTNLVVLQNFLYGLTSIWKMLLFETLNYTFSFLTDKFKCKHKMSFN